MKTLIINKTKNRSLVIDKTMLKKAISLYNGKIFLRKYITKTCLYSKIGVYVFFSYLLFGNRKFNFIL